uniref:Uncharacterized protein n=1 Tax=Solanum lycopersicum TaxID=4081 RepID=A0A494G998_SOLLC
MVGRFILHPKLSIAITNRSRRDDPVPSRRHVLQPLCRCHHPRRTRGRPIGPGGGRRACPVGQGAKRRGPPGPAAGDRGRRLSGEVGRLIAGAPKAKGTRGCPFSCPTCPQSDERSEAITDAQVRHHRIDLDLGVRLDLGAIGQRRGEVGGGRDRHIRHRNTDEPVVGHGIVGANVEHRVPRRFGRRGHGRARTELALHETLVGHALAGEPRVVHADTDVRAELGLRIKEVPF